MQEQEYRFGANIIENLTTGMYQDSKVIYREYIQNACDQIDKAIEEGILQQNEGQIEIWFDQNNRTVTIRDNATGITAADFQRVLGNIADSDKDFSKDKGFRGIGRLCGLAYCRELIFESKAKGENIISKVICNAQKMRNLITEHHKGKKHEAGFVLKQIFHFETEQTDNNNDHYFTVELKGINDENNDLLDKIAIKNYLSFVAPVPYQNTFRFRTNIKKYAQEKNYNIDEYNIKLDGEQIFKNYTDKIKDNKGECTDEIFDIEFYDVKDENGNLLAWMWLGLSKFDKVLPKKTNPMRSFRLRKGNIQIGNEDVLQKLFNEERGQNYFVGEVFAVSTDLIPNSQRDYFNETPTRRNFEDSLQNFFSKDLYKIYYDGSKINSSVKKITDYEKDKTEYNKKEKTGIFINEEQKKNEYEKLKDKRLKAENAQNEIKKINEKAKENGGVYGQIIEQVINKVVKEENCLKPAPLPIQRPIQKRRTDELGKFNSKERKIIERVFEIIHLEMDTETADKLIDKITKGLKKGLR
ncbi:MAG: ATP-binding protein [Planctomycetaceae bacterium]|jgi:molecular chaperone HtpG|nr:ATP-binding protein [Planctomycetaceae bacterium]